MSQNLQETVSFRTHSEIASRCVSSTYERGTKSSERGGETKRGRRQALRNGFRESERLFLEFAQSQEKEAGDVDRSGSCAVVILIIDDMCYCANTGDSRAIMSADGGEKLFLLSTDHKPTDEIEMERILNNNGRIY